MKPDGDQSTVPAPAPDAKDDAKHEAAPDAKDQREGDAVQDWLQAERNIGKDRSPK